ncbi:Elongator complex protein 5 [Phyllosticta citriasiana]|uniref:Elongator complex protein 5 n=1 Tax=Phyllosticta citriasiana TaxID=595635 RepID=A0ABR1KHP2_9PEZI
MALSKQAEHRRAHNLLLMSKLLSCRDNMSPFTLIIDTLEKSGKGVVREFVKRANAGKIKIVLVSFETLKKPRGVDVLVHGTKQTPAVMQRELLKIVAEAKGKQKVLLVFDNLNSLCDHPSTSSNLPEYLSSFLGPNISLLATYHADVPLSFPHDPYVPHPLTLLKYLVTTILRPHSLHHVLAEKAARDKSQASPVFGLSEEVEGVVGGLGRNAGAAADERSGSAEHLRRGVVLEMEYRRKSGRGVHEWFFLPEPPQGGAVTGKELKTAQTAQVLLLDDHPLHRHVPDVGETALEGDEFDTTFNLGLTEKQRRDREGVVLPYFDAQSGEGPGEGGRILYDMGEEDDFDEEEDEI